MVGLVVAVAQVVKAGLHQLAGAIKKAHTLGSNTLVQLLPAETLRVITFNTLVVIGRGYGIPAVVLGRSRLASKTVILSIVTASDITSVTFG